MGDIGRFFYWKQPATAVNEIRSLPGFHIVDRGEVYESLSQAVSRLGASNTIEIVGDGPFTGEGNAEMAATQRNGIWRRRCPHRPRRSSENSLAESQWRHNRYLRNRAAVQAFLYLTNRISRDIVFL